jgi:hypothetical protein
MLVTSLDRFLLTGLALEREHSRRVLESEERADPFSVTLRLAH